MALHIPEQFEMSTGSSRNTITGEQLEVYARSIPIIAKVPVDLPTKVLKRSIRPIFIEGNPVGYSVSDYYYAGDDPRALERVGFGEPVDPSAGSFVSHYSLGGGTMIGPFKYHVHRYSQNSVDEAADSEHLARLEVDYGLGLRSSITDDLNTGMKSGVLPVEFFSAISERYGHGSYRETVLGIKSGKSHREYRRLPIIGKVGKGIEVVDPVLDEVVDYLRMRGFTRRNSPDETGVAVYEASLEPAVFTHERLITRAHRILFRPKELVILVDRETEQGRALESRKRRESIEDMF